MKRTIFLFLIAIFTSSVSAVSIPDWRQGSPRDITFDKVDARRAVAMILDKHRNDPRQIVPLIRFVQPAKTPGQPTETILLRSVAINPITNMWTIATISYTEKSCNTSSDNFILDLQEARDMFYTIIDRIDRPLYTSSPDTIVRFGCNVYELSRGHISEAGTMTKEPAVYGKSSAAEIALDFVCRAATSGPSACECYFAKLPHIYESIVFEEPQNCSKIKLEDVVFDPVNLLRLTFIDRIDPW